MGIILLYINNSYAQVPTVSYSGSPYTFSEYQSASASPTSSGVYPANYAAPADFQAVNNVYAVAYDALDNYLYSVDYSDNLLYRYNFTTGTSTTYTVNSPTGLAVDGNGNVYVSSIVVTTSRAGTTYTSTIYKFDKNGNRTTITSGLLNQPYGIAIDASNNVYIANGGNNNILKITAGTTTVSTYYTGTLGSAPYGIIIDASNRMFISEPNANTVLRVTSTNSTSTFYSTNLSAPRGLQVDNNGNIYIADYGNNAIKRVSNPGNSGTGTLTLTLSTGISAPRQIDFDASGNMYEADYGTDEVQELTASSYSISGTLPAGLSFDTSTGQISGTPTALSASTSYTVTAYNTYGSSSATVKIAVTALAVTSSNYTFSQPITLNTNSAGITTTLTNFPALVYIKEDALKTSTNDCFNGLQYPTGGTNGYDFAFTVSGSTTELPYQVESYDASTGTLLAWVQIPSVTNAVTNLTFYFGSQSPAHTAAFTASTWASDYQAVYHLNEGSTTASVLDATSNARNATQTSTTVATGQVTGAYQFDGTATKIISTGTSNNVTGSFTLSVWVKPLAYTVSSTSGGYDHKLITNEANNYTTGGYKLGLYGANSSPVKVYGEVETRPNGGSPASLDRSGYTGTATAVTLNAWHYVQGVYDASSNTFYSYLDGKLDKTLTGAAAAGSTGQNIYLGSDFSSSNYLNGILDEARISSNAKSADWIKMEYYNQTNQISFTGSNTAITGSTANAPSLGASNESAGALIYTWTGTTSTDPTVATNWIAPASSIASSILVNLAPAFNGTESLVIPVVSTNRYPALKANASINGLSIAAGASLNLNGFTLNVGCNIVNNNTGSAGILTGTDNASTVNWNSSILANQYYRASSAATNQVGNMTVNNTAGGTVTITGGPVSLYNLLTITQGNLAVDNTNSGLLTLISTASQTASVAAIPSGYSITGKVNVQRFLTGGSTKSGTVYIYRGYRFLSSPVNITSATPSSSGTNYIDLSTLKSSYSVNGTTYYGAFIGGAGGTSGGFSVYNANPTIYFLKELLNVSNATFTSGKNVGVTSIGAGTVTLTDGTTYNMPVGNGYILYYVGSSNSSVRTTGASTIAPDNATVTNVGYLNQGSIPVKLWYTPAGSTSTSVGKLSYSSSIGSANSMGYNMLGNPYASSIDLNKVYTENSSSSGYNTFFVLSNINAGQRYYGYNAATGATQSTTYSSRYIMSGQGFLVVATAANQTLTFNEDQKVTNQLTSTTSPVLVLAAQPGKSTAAQGQADLSGVGLQSVMSVQATAGNVFPRVHVMVQQDSTNTDECGIYFNNDWSDKFDKNDAVYLDASAAKTTIFSYTADGTRVGINSLSDYTAGKNVKLFVSGTTSGLYKLKLTDMQYIDTTVYSVILHDHYKKDSLDLGIYKTYNFNVSTSDTTSFGANRFVLSIVRKSLPAYQLVSFTGQKATDGVQLTWKTYNEGDFTGFTLQRMDGTQQFIPIYQLQSNGHGTYTYVDKAAVNGANTYKLMSNDVNNRNTYSNVVTIILGNNDKEGMLLSVYPNPVASSIRVAVASDNAVVTSGINLYVKVMSTDGRVISAFNSSGNIASTDVSSLKPGTYIIEATDIATKKSYGRKMFVKL